MANCLGECAVETGRNIGADYVVTGEVLSFAGQLRINLTLHETQTGNLISSVRAGASDLLGLEEPIDAKSIELFRPLHQNQTQSLTSSEYEIGDSQSIWVPDGVSAVVVQFKSEPTGALVELDDQVIGETPCSRPLTHGTYEVTIRRIRYVTHSEVFEVGPDESNSLHVTLTPDFGWLSVNSNPSGLTVAIDGEQVGETPVTKREIDRGLHEIVIQNQQYYPKGNRIVIDRGEHEHLNIIPTPINGGLNVHAVDGDSNAVDAVVYVDGVELGRAYVPMTILVGIHEVEVRSDQGSWSGEITIEERKLKEVTTELTDPEDMVRDITTEFVRNLVDGNRTRGLNFAMEEIPTGSFNMGSEIESGRDKDETLHRVTIRDTFYISTTEITQSDWQEVMGNNPSFYQGDDYPVERVTWYDCILFCNKLSQLVGLQEVYTIERDRVIWDRRKHGYRLPTEAEWEYTCRAGTSTRFYKGDSVTDLASDGWYHDNSRGRTHSVGIKEPNAWGVYDMHGNVWEWCWDWYDEYPPRSSTTDPIGPVTGKFRVVRGGSWGNSIWGCRSAARTMYLPDYKYRNGGFRIVLD